MANFTDDQLLEIIDGGESDRVEFKESLLGNAPDKIREAICAFANDLPNHEKPGLVFIGVKNKGTIVDKPITDGTLRQLADMKTDGNILPPPSMMVERRILQGKEVGLVIVQPSNSTPVRYKGTIRIRIGSRRAIATAQEESILNEKRQHGDRPFDIQPISRAELSDLNLAYFEHEYLVKAFSEEVLDANDRSLKEQLAATKMIIAADDPTPTVLGILTLGKNPQDFIPGAYLQFLRIDGSEMNDEIIDSLRIEGSIPSMLHRLSDKLIAHNRTAVQIGPNLTERRTHLYPLEAIQHIAWNAIMHRTYDGKITNAPVRILWFNDRIEIISPGGLFGHVTSENIGLKGIVDYRNPNLADAMRTAGYIQKFGIGIPLSKRLLVEAGHPEPEFEFDKFVRVTIRPFQSNKVI